MKKKIFFTLLVVAILACLFTICVSADTIVSSESDAYGTLCQFDEAIGNTQITNLKDDGTVARTVLTDGNGKYYTVPTVCILTEHYKNRGDVAGEMFNLSFGEISSALDFTVSKNSIIRIEFPSDIKFICNGNENLSGCGNMVECIMNDGVYFWDNDPNRKVFTNCKKLKSIDVSGMVMDREKTTFAMFEYCDELEYVKLPNAYLKADGTYMDYNTSHMFSGCYKLKTIENFEEFFKGDKTLNYKTFYNCYVLEEIKLPDGLEIIEGRAIGNCKAITTMVIPDSVTQIGTNETVFESCISLKTLVLPKSASFGDYCFEKCTGLTNIWMPTEASTFSKQVFGQCGSNLNVTFYFATTNNVVTVTDNNFNKDPYLSAINNQNGDSRLVFNAPLSTKCTVFLGGHDLSGEGVYGFSGESYVSDFEKVTCCARGCGEQITETICAPLFENKGFSAAEYEGGGMSIGFKVNKAAILAYEEITGETVNYGVFAVLAEKIGANDIFDSEGKALAGVIAADITDTDFDIFNLKIVGFTDKQVDIDLAMGAYVGTTKDGATEYAYLQDVTTEKNEKYYFASYNDVKAILDANNGVSAQ